MTTLRTAPVTLKIRVQSYLCKLEIKLRRIMVQRQERGNSFGPENLTGQEGQQEKLL